MNKLLHPITDWVSTKRGMWITIIFWLVLMIGLSAGPKLNDYKVTSFQSLPDDAASIIAQEKVDEYFPKDQGTPGILVFTNGNGDINVSEVTQILDAIFAANIAGIDTIVDISTLKPDAVNSFISEDDTTMIVPMMLEDGLDNAAFSEINGMIAKVGTDVANSLESTQFYITGPAGIAGDTTKLFSEADFNLLFATIVIILVLLITIYRSPLLAFIPLLATVIVYQIVNQTVALLGVAGLEINNSTTSIMSILLFAAVIDYSLFVFSRYREELNNYENKYEAMKHAMRATGEPVFFAGFTVLAAMLILFFADFRDYQNFAPVFGTAIFFIMLASITLVPALFTLFGRKAFWPKVPKYGEEKKVKHGIWGPIATFVVNRPIISGGTVAVILLITSLNVFNLNYEFDTVKSFPEDLPSRVGYEIVEEKFDKGELAPTTLLLESDRALTKQQIFAIQDYLSTQEGVASVRFQGLTEDEKNVKYSVALSLNPYSIEAIELIDTMRKNSAQLLEDFQLSGEVHFAGVTAKLVDERDVNYSDIYKIVILEKRY